MLIEGTSSATSLKGSTFTVTTNEIICIGSGYVTTGTYFAMFSDPTNDKAIYASITALNNASVSFNIKIITGVSTITYGSVAAFVNGQFYFSGNL